MTKEDVINLVNKAIDEALQTINPYVVEWFDSSTKDREREIQDLKDEIKRQIEKS